MARVTVAALLIAALLSFAGCSALFEFNAFSSLDKPAAPKLSDYQGSGGLAKLQKDLSSAAVVASLKADPATTKDIEDYLATFLPPSDANGQTAAALLADLNLKTTSGDQLVNNAANAVLTQTSWTGDIKAILTGIIPAEVQADHAAFVAMVDGLLAANSAYMQLGTSIPSIGVPQGMNMGDVAQKAAVAYLVRTVVDQVKLQSSLPDDATAVEQLYLLVDGQPNAISGDTIASNPLDPGSPVGWLKNLFDAAHLPYPG
jgi:hypothetical protein